MALELKIVGGLMTAALIAVPAVTSRMICRNLNQYISFAVILGMLFAVVGIVLSKVTAEPAGILITLSATLTFLGVLFFKSRRLAN